jgi:ABC-2 type transport system permease protein
VAGDYFSYVMIGVVSIQVMAVGLSAFTTNLDFIIQQGRFESYLVEPINWRLLPFGIGAWPMLVNTVLALMMGVMAVLLGATYDLSSLPIALVVLALGVLAGHAVGILAASIKVISKRGDPIIGMYTLATGLLSGAIFPVSLLPAPFRVIAYCLPPTYVISALRRLLLPDGAELTGPTAGQAILLLLAFIAIVYPIAIWLYGRSLEYGRKMGLLAGY